MRAQTIADLFQAAVDDHGPRTAMRYPREGDWHPVTYAQLGRLVEEATVGLAQLGVDPGDPVGLLTGNRPLATIADLAITHAGATLVPLDPDDASAEGKRLAQPDVDGAFVDPATAAEAAVPTDTIVLLTDEETPDDDDPIAMSELYRRGQQVLGEQPAPFAERWRAVEADDPAAVLPQDEPLALTHANVAANVAAAAATWPIDPGDRAASLAAPSTRFGREVGPLALLAQGAEVWYPSTSVLPEHVRTCQPDLLVTSQAPLARLQADVEERLAASEPMQRQLFTWAHDIGHRASRARADRGPGLGLRAKRWLAEGLVLAQMRAKMGLGKTRIVTPAPLADEHAEWFRALGVPVAEPYAHPAAGLVTVPEASPAPAQGGPPAPRTDVRSRDEAAPSRIQVRGASVPDQAPDTSEDGWLTTDRAGRITDGRVLELEG
jgi:long-chain acyl-CoA synthetase